MQEFKKAHFARDNPGVEFPAHVALPSAESGKVRARIASLVGVSSEVGRDVLDHAVYEQEAPVLGPGNNAEHATFDLLEMFGRLGITPANECYINWRDFVDIDRIATAAVARFFSDIWYPATDDIELWDDSYEWIISIDHGGWIRYAKFEA